MKIALLVRCFRLQGVVIRDVFGYTCGFCGDTMDTLALLTRLSR